jgi:hypothetical protein
MKKTIAIAGIALLLIGVTGCSSATTDSGLSKQTQDYVVPVTTPTDDFLSEVHMYGDAYIESTADSDLVSMATATCDALDAGNTVTDVITYLAYNQTETDQAFYVAEGEIIGAAVRNICPQYIPQLP